MTVSSDYPFAFPQTLHPTIIFWEGYSYTVLQENPLSLRYLNVITAVGKTYTTVLGSSASLASVKCLSPIYTPDDLTVASDGYPLYLPQSDLSHLQIYVTASSLLCDDTSASISSLNPTYLKVTLANLPPFLQENEGLHIQIHSTWDRNSYLQLHATLNPFTFFSVENISHFVKSVEKPALGETQIVWEKISQEHDNKDLFEAMPEKTFKVLMRPLDTDKSGMPPNSQSQIVDKIIVRNTPMQDHPTGFLLGYPEHELRGSQKIFYIKDRIAKLGFQLIG